MTGARRHRLVIGVLICTLVVQISNNGRLLFAQQADTLDPMATREYAVALGFQKKKLFEQAAVRWTQFIAGFGNDTRIPNAHYHLGVCQLQSGNAEAAATFLKVLTQFPKFEQRDAVQFNLGLALYNKALTSKTSDDFKAAADALLDFEAGVVRFAGRGPGKRDLAAVGDSREAGELDGQGIGVFVVVVVAVRVAADHVDAGGVVEVGKGRRALRDGVKPVERIASADYGGEGGRIDVTGVFVVEEDPRVFADYEVEVAVVIEVDERGLRVVAHIDAVEGARDARDEGEDGGGGRAGVVVEEQSAREVAGYQVEVAIAVEVAQGGRTASPVDFAVERIVEGGGDGERRRIGVARVLDEAELPIVAARDDVEVAIVIDIDQHRRSLRTRRHAVKRIADARQLREGRRGIIAGVFQIDKATGFFTADDIEVAIAIHIAERRRAERFGKTRRKWVGHVAGGDFGERRSGEEQCGALVRHGLKEPAVPREVNWTVRAVRCRGGLNKEQSEAKRYGSDAGPAHEARVRK